MGNLNDAFLKREKRLAKTVAWILLILVLTYYTFLAFFLGVFWLQKE